MHVASLFPSPLGEACQARPPAACHGMGFISAKFSFIPFHRGVSLFVGESENVAFLEEKMWDF